MASAAIPRATKPELAGKRCQALICEQFVDHGKVLSTAAVVYLRAGDVWHRLSIDHPDIFWRSVVESPKPWAVRENGWSYPHQNIANEAGLNGLAITDVLEQSDSSATRVIFKFAGGIAVVITGDYEGTHVSVT